MIIKQVKEYFTNKNEIPCPLTEKLIKSGYQQTSGGYIDLAKKQGLLVNYEKSLPSQWWHLMEYCNSVDNDKVFAKSIVCGELIFWMAEVSNAVPKHILNSLLNEIIDDGKQEGNRVIYDRRKWNKRIQNICFDAIALAIKRK